MTIAGLFHALFTYETSACTPARPPACLAHDAGQPLLLLFVHPRCPCSRATATALDRLLHRTRGAVAARVYVFSDPSQSPAWHRTGLWHRLAAIPGVALHEDPLGTAAARHGAATSGQCLLYGAGGLLLFAGGITPARGHEGDCDGLTAVERLLSGVSGPEVVRTPVFGCSVISGPPEDTE